MTVKIDLTKLHARDVEMNLKDIVVKFEYYPRITLNEYTITQYKEQYELGESLPPLVVQKEKHILIDGFHRFEAQKRLGYEDVEINLMDIPEDEIYLTSIELNRRHGLAFSKEDRDEQIRKLRFETTPPLTYEKIGKAVGRSTSRIGEICREKEFKINGIIIPKVDARRNITTEETEEIQDRLDTGEPTSDVAKDYPVSESRISQLKKEPRKSKPYKRTKQKILSQMPISWTRRSLEKRFNANNPLVDSQEIDFDAYLDVEDFEFYHDLVDEFKRLFPEYEWYYPRERAMFDPYAGIPSELVYDKSIEIQLKLYWIDEGKYAQVKGTIPKKILEYVRDRLHDEFTVEWPLVEVERPEERPYPELSDDELYELYEESLAQHYEPENEEDEEMKKWGDLIPD